MKLLCPDESKPVNKTRYYLYLTSYLIGGEQTEHQTSTLDQQVVELSKEIYKQNVNVDKLWRTKEVNAAMVAHRLMEAVKNIDILDCIACYFRCDPLKAGTVNTSAIVALLKQRISDATDYNNGAIFKLSKNWYILVYMAFWALGALDKFKHISLQSVTQTVSQTVKHMVV